MAQIRCHMHLSILSFFHEIYGSIKIDIFMNREIQQSFHIKIGDLKQNELCYKGTFLEQKVSKHRQTKATNTA